MWFWLVFFILPGFFCGFAGGNEALALSAVHSAGYLCAGMAGGLSLVHYGELRKILPCLAPFAFLLLMVPAGTALSLAAAGFSAGIVAALPERLTGKNGKLLFLLSAFAGIMTLYFAGAWRLTYYRLGIFVMLAPLPAVLGAGWHGLRGRWPEKIILSLFIALAVAGAVFFQFLYPHLIPWSKSAGAGCFYRVNYPEAGNAGRFDLSVCGGQSYHFPSAYSRAVPAVLPASLEPDKNELRVLFVGEVPSGVPSLFESLPWVKSVDLHILAPAASNMSGRYDLVFVSELPCRLPEKDRAGFLLHLKKNTLAANGVLVYPSRETGGGKTLLPGAPEFFMYQHSGKTLTGDINEIDRRLAVFSPAGAEIFPAGLMETLYSLRPGEKEPESVCRAGDWRSGIHVTWPVILFTAGIYWLLRLWCGRYPGVTPCANALELGLAAGIIVYAGTASGENPLLSGSHASALLPVLLVGTVPGMLSGGRRRWRFILLLIFASSWLFRGASLSFVLSGCLLCGTLAGRRPGIGTGLPYLAGVVAGVYFAPVFPGVLLMAVLGLLIFPGLAGL